MSTPWRSRALVAIGGLLVVLMGIGVYQQQQDARDAWIVVALVQGALYLGAARLVWRSGFSRRVLVMILAIAALMRLAVLFTPPYLSDDIYRYVWDGRVQAAGINPYRYVPVDQHLAPLRDAAIYPHINRSTYAPTIYPPVAEALFFAVTRVSESVTWMKAAMVALEAATIAILIRLLLLNALPLERILIYAWHPLTVWEFAGSGHLDAAITTFVALALWARRREAAWLTGIALGCAVLVKFFPGAILPALYRRWDWKMPAAAAAVVILGYVPYLAAGPAVVGFLPKYLSEEGLTNGTGFFLWNLVTMTLPLAGLGVYPYLAFAAIVLAALAIHAALAENGADRFMARAAVLAFAFTALLSPHFPWYFCWTVTFLCFVPYVSMRYVSVASFLLYFVSGGPDLDGSRLLVEAAMYGPFAVMALFEFRRSRAGSIEVKA